MIGAIPSIRDVRYLLPIAVPFVYFASRGLNIGSRATRKRLTSLAFGFTLVFLVISFSVATEQYAGPPEAAVTLESLGLSEATIMSNFNHLHNFLPHINLVDLDHKMNATQAYSLALSREIDAVAILHHYRGAWPQPLPESVKALRALFRSRTSGGPSNFSWYEIFYDRLPVQGEALESDHLGSSARSPLAKEYQLVDLVPGDSKPKHLASRVVPTIATCHKPMSWL